jgi:hypothetical protein
VLGTLSRRQNDFDERGVTSRDKGKLHRAAQELPAQAPTAYSAIGPYHACSARCRAVKMVMASAVSSRAIEESSIELLKSCKLKRPHRRIRPRGRIKRARYAAAPSDGFTGAASLRATTASFFELRVSRNFGL